MIKNFNKKEKIELLAPAGSYEKAKLALAYGADAIYIGIPLYSLRGKENKFTLEEAKKITEYAHSLGKKVYFTINIYFHNFKIPIFLKNIEEVSKLKPDAIIVSDVGIIYYLKENYPELELHLSVQANSTNYLAAKFWEKNGISRIILPRELTIKEIKEIIEKNQEIEFEVFIHGSLCMAYSGRCLLSNYFSYRDANQGLCNNSCRWKYKLYKTDNEYFDETMKDSNYKQLDGKYFVEEAKREGELYEIEENSEGSYILNSKDLCAIEFLEDLIKIGVKSLKIEGRNKSEYYVATIVRTYRKALDDLYNGKEPDYDELIKEINTTSNRGFIPGFLAGNLKGLSHNYEHTSLYNTHAFVGIVREVKILSRNKSKVFIELKNKIELGDELEFMMPLPEEIRKYKLDKIRVNGEEVKKYSPGTKNLVELELPFVVTEPCLIKKLLK